MKSCFLLNCDRARTFLPARTSPILLRPPYPNLPYLSHLQNITLENTDIRHFDGDAMVVRNSNTVNIDGRNYDE